MKRDFRSWLIDALNGMAIGLFSSLIIGLILKQIGVYLHLPMLVDFGQLAQKMMCPAIGVGVAYRLNAHPLAMLSAATVGTIGGGAVVVKDSIATLAIGEPVGAFVAVVFGIFAGRLIAGKTSLDILLEPAVSILVGGSVGVYLSPYIARLMTIIGEGINFATEREPFLMSILISLIMGILLTLPISSAAIGIALGLSGYAAGAGVIGCASHMVGFAVASYKENGVGGLVAQGLGTSMLQIGNIIRNPLIALPAIISSILVAPLGILVFKMKAVPLGSGMGTSGLVGQFATIEVMGLESWWKILLLHFLLPGLIAYLTSQFMRKKGYIKPGDMKLELK